MNDSKEWEARRRGLDSEAATDEEEAALDEAWLKKVLLGAVRWAIVYRVLNDRLQVVEEVDVFNVEAEESVYEKQFVPRGLSRVAGFCDPLNQKLWRVVMTQFFKGQR